MKKIGFTVLLTALFSSYSYSQCIEDICVNQKVLNSQKQIGTVHDIDNSQEIIFYKLHNDSQSQMATASELIGEIEEYKSLKKDEEITLVDGTSHQVDHIFKDGSIAIRDYENQGYLRLSFEDITADAISGVKLEKRKIQLFVNKARYVREALDTLSKYNFKVKLMEKKFIDKDQPYILYKVSNAFLSKKCKIEVGFKGEINLDNFSENRTFGSLSELCTEKLNELIERQLL